LRKILNGGYTKLKQKIVNYKYLLYLSRNGQIYEEHSKSSWNDVLVLRYGHVTLKPNAGLVPQLGHVCFIPNPFQSILPYHQILYSPNTESIDK
jgi:hypothetical protein